MQKKRRLVNLAFFTRRNSSSRRLLCVFSFLTDGKWVDGDQEVVFPGFPPAGRAIVAIVPTIAATVQGFPTGFANLVHEYQFLHRSMISWSGQLCLNITSCL